MGLHVSSKMVVGLELDNLLVKKEEISHITKYDENDGLPYQKRIVEMAFFWCGKEVDPPDYMEEFVKEMCGLEFYETAADDEGRIVGKQIGEKVCFNGVASVDEEELLKAFKEVKFALEKSGYKGDISLHLVSWAG